MINTKNPRAKKLNSIMTKIAMFTVQETYTGEQEAQSLLAKAIESIEKAQALLIKSDEEHQKEMA